MQILTSIALYGLLQLSSASNAPLVKRNHAHARAQAEIAQPDFENHQIYARADGPVSVMNDQADRMIQPKHGHPWVTPPVPTSTEDIRTRTETYTYTWTLDRPDDRRPNVLARRDPSRRGRRTRVRTGRRSTRPTRTRADRNRSQSSTIILPVSGGPSPSSDVPPISPRLFRRSLRLSRANQPVTTTNAVSENPPTWTPRVEDGGASGAWGNRTRTDVGIFEKIAMTLRKPFMKSEVEAVDEKPAIALEKRAFPTGISFGIPSWPTTMPSFIPTAFPTQFPTSIPEFPTEMLPTMTIGFKNKAAPLETASNTPALGHAIVSAIPAGQPIANMDSNDGPMPAPDENLFNPSGRPRPSQSIPANGEPFI